MSRIDDLRMMIAEIEDELNDTCEDDGFDVDSALCRLADLRHELKELERTAPHTHT